VAKRRVLYLCHNHPDVRPGGAEAYSLELFKAMREAGEYEPMLVARTGPPLSAAAKPHDGTIFSHVNDDPNQYFVHADGYDYDWIFGTFRTKEIYVKHFRDFLLAHRPDIVHFQHTLHLGYDLIRLVRNTLPDAAIVYTLHEFVPICHRQGQMVRNNGDPCMESSPRRCHECFPSITPQTFFLRKKFAMSSLDLVDLFIAPSRFLLERYADWGIPRDRLRLEEYGRRFVASVTDEPPHGSSHRFGFFGQINPYKGVTVLLEAMRLLNADGGTPPPQLWVHGANLDLQESSFQKEMTRLLSSTERNVTFVGSYEPAQLPSLMREVDWVVVPSTWWENSPLVIQEAFRYGRPVLCSNIGGMAEKVADGINGLHFIAGDARSLAATIRRAAGTPGLWERLREGIPDVYGMDEHVPAIANIYSELLANRAQLTGTAGAVAG
jgi:glycosyltransferase involved in cell wall biosynthesis